MHYSMDYLRIPYLCKLRPLQNWNIIPKDGGDTYALCTYFEGVFFAFSELHLYRKPPMLFWVGMLDQAYAGRAKVLKQVLKQTIQE